MVLYHASHISETEVSYRRRRGLARWFALTFSVLLYSAWFVVVIRYTSTEDGWWASLSLGSLLWVPEVQCSAVRITMCVLGDFRQFRVLAIDGPWSSFHFFPSSLSQDSLTQVPLWLVIVWREMYAAFYRKHAHSGTLKCASTASFVTRVLQWASRFAGRERG